MYKKLSSIMFLILSMSSMSVMSAATKKVAAKKQVAPKKKTAPKKPANPLASFNSKKLILENDGASYASRIRAALELQVMLGKMRGDAKLLKNMCGFSLRKSTSGVITIPAVKKLDKKATQRIQKSLDTMSAELNAWTKNFSTKVDELNADRQAKIAQLGEINRQLETTQNSLRTSLDQSQETRAHLENVSNTNARLISENSALTCANADLLARNDELMRASTTEHSSSTELSTQCSHLRAQHDAFETRNGQLTAANVELTGRCTRLDAEKAILVTHNAELEARCGQLNAAGQALAVRNTELETRCGQLNVEKELLTAKLNEMCSKFARLLTPCIDFVTGTCNADTVKQKTVDMLEADNKRLATTRDLQVLLGADQVLIKQLDDAIARWMAPASRIATYVPLTAGVLSSVGLAALAARQPWAQGLASGLANMIRPAATNSVA